MKFNPEQANLLLFDLLDKEEDIVHFSTTRIGGVSNGTYASLNLGNFSDDSSLNIYENRSILARMFYKKPEDFIIPHQTHGSRVLLVDTSFLSLDRSTKISKLYGIDATVTQEKDVFLCATTADCVPILLYDRNKKAIAAIHAGWRGTVERIVEKTVVLMQKTFGSSPADLLAAIGPAISMAYYEVGDEVLEAFHANGFDLTGAFFRATPHSKMHIDLKEINRMELIRLGVLPRHIEKSSYCTFENEHLFFSARRQTVHSGRMLTGILLKK